MGDKCLQYLNCERNRTPRIKEGEERLVGGSWRLEEIFVDGAMVMFNRHHQFYEGIDLFAEGFDLMRV